MIILKRPEDNFISSKFNNPVTDISRRLTSKTFRNSAWENIKQGKLDEFQGHPALLFVFDASCRIPGCWKSKLFFGWKVFPCFLSNSCNVWHTCSSSMKRRERDGEIEKGRSIIYLSDHENYFITSRIKWKHFFSFSSFFVFCCFIFFLFRVKLKEKRLVTSNWELSKLSLLSQSLSLSLFWFSTHAKLCFFFLMSLFPLVHEKIKGSTLARHKLNAEIHKHTLKWLIEWMIHFL